MAQKLTTCTFCGVGCGIYLETAGSQITGAYPSMSHPTNEGRICVRGWHVHEVASSPDRLKRPLLRKRGQFEEVSWSEAFQYVAGRLRDIHQRHGSQALAFFNSPRCSNEEAYLLQKMARAIFQTNNVDHGSGVYCNNSINVLSEMIGLPATTNSISELAQSEVILVDRVDLAAQLPTIGGWVIRAKLKGARLIVIDARRHRLAEHADYFLQLRPGTGVLLYGAMAKVIIDRGLLNTAFIKNHCRDFEAFLDHAHQFDLLTCAEICGVPAPLIEAAAIVYAQAKSAALLYSTGIETRGKDSIRALVDLVLLTGNLGKPGAGLYALTEQNNLQGVCDMGMLPDHLPGYQPVARAPARERLGRLWGARLPDQPGLGARAMLGRQAQSSLRALWLCRYDPVTTAFFGDAATTLQQLDLVVVQHLFMTGTAQFAHVVLPVVAFGEEQVSFTSTERRIQIAEQVIDPPPGPLPAWRQITEVAQRLGADWNYGSASEIMEEIGAAVPFYSGASYDNLSREYGRQWPCTKDKPLGTRYLFDETIAGRPFRFQLYTRNAAIFGATPEYPLALVFGHSLYYWHQNVLVKHSETLKREMRVLLLDYPQGFVDINSEDAQLLGIRDGNAIRLVAPTGAATTTARVTQEVRPGTVFMPYFANELERQIIGESTGEKGHLGKPVFVRLEKM
jgi:predicted molibdopterin-dependent oxidoreductase YjgC